MKVVMSYCSYPGRLASIRELSHHQLPSEFLKVFLILPFIGAHLSDRETYCQGKNEKWFRIFKYSGLMLPVDPDFLNTNGPDKVLNQKRLNHSTIQPIN